MIENQNVDALISQVVSGTATESDYGVALKALQNQLSVSLVTSLSQTYNSVTALNSMLADAVNKLVEQFNAQSDILELKDLLEMVESITGKQLQMIEALRKTVQGGQLFAADTLSDDEKKVLKLFQSFKSVEEKAKFLNLVEAELNA